MNAHGYYSGVHNDHFNLRKERAGTAIRVTKFAPCAIKNGSINSAIIQGYNMEN